MSFRFLSLLTFLALAAPAARAQVSVATPTPEAAAVQLDPYRVEGKYSPLDPKPATAARAYLADLMA
jgi:hypothetical protein